MAPGSKQTHNVLIVLLLVCNIATVVLLRPWDTQQAEQSVHQDTIASLETELQDTRRQLEQLVQSISLQDAIDVPCTQLASPPENPVQADLELPELAERFQDLARVVGVFASDFAPAPLPAVTSRIFVTMAGHLRSQALNLANFESWVEPMRAQGAQIFLAEYLWSDLDAPQDSWWKKNGSALVKEQTLIHGKPVDILAKQIEPALRRLQIPGRFTVAPADIVMSTRPDVLYERSFAVRPLVAFLKRNPMTVFVMSFYHDPTKTGAHHNDPCELNWITSVQGYNAIIQTVQTMDVSTCTLGTSNPGLHEFQLLMFKCAPVTVRYLSPDWSIHYHRLSGETAAFPNRNAWGRGRLLVSGEPLDLVQTHRCKKPFFGVRHVPIAPIDRNGLPASTVFQQTAQGISEVPFNLTERVWMSPNLDDNDDIPYCPYINRQNTNTKYFGTEGLVAHGQFV
ncbi:hypothetical protein CAOG_07334 [Capsaspora owczarzaki ATCC 30864]|uniref:hypothetical protein n=1 Tax=Capsaspora owczarzaki (strain ATCC 30864) TaxID=595528 RepID=UPI0001FE4664|nr:hypothetical protein CAOG_07334 [Capsaspora owczarzaki ATCC 30864]|eukprot:XP_004343193.1 hypothetical protein CAOG_07334 [Capsaspora owczarzaki ATCC 30864]